MKSVYKIGGMPTCLRSVNTGKKITASKSRHKGARGVPEAL